MRTKLVLTAAVLAAGLATSMAQVYSLNVVGYVNVTLPAGQFAAVANPLDASVGLPGGNDITNLFSSAAGNIAGGSSLATFNSAANDYDPSIAYSGKSSTWAGNFAMPPGKGALYFNAGGADTVVTFVGEVKQGTYNVGTLPAQAFALVGSPVPIGGVIQNSTTAVGLVPSGGDTVATFNSAANDWSASVAWSAKGSAWSGALPINAGQGFLYFNASAGANTWVSNFTVQ